MVRFGRRADSIETGEGGHIVNTQWLLRVLSFVLVGFAIFTGTVQAGIKKLKDDNEATKRDTQWEIRYDEKKIKNPVFTGKKEGSNQGTLTIEKVWEKET
jgi:hypothetical protein